MSGFAVHTGKIAVYAADNVDTDRIIPARFLSRVSRFGYGELLFADVRGGDFPLDKSEAEGATILVAGTNFGCGSSREHAVWAIQQAGFVAVVAKKEADSPGYSDIFRSNAGNCGLLLTELPEEAHAKFVAAGSGAEATVDLPRQKIVLDGEEFHFDIAETTKQQLLAGLDLVGTTLQYADEITEFEKEWSSFAPETVTP